MELNWIGVGLAFVVGMAVAMAWYGKVFLALWRRLTGITPQDSKKASKRNLVQLLVANGVTAIWLGAGIAVAQAAFGRSAGLAVAVGLTAWLTLSATTLLQHNAFELKPAKLTVLNAAYQLVLFMAMALAIGLA